MNGALRPNRRDFLVAGSALAVTSAVTLRVPAFAAPMPKPGSVGSAFIVGTDTYASLDPLTRAADDARAVAKRMEAIGYRPFSAINQPRAAILERFAEFKASVFSGGAAFLYFAGHGLQLRGTNYLLPTDADCSSPEAFDRTAMSLNELMRDIAGLRPDQALAVIDACRNPLAEIDLPDRQNGMTSVDAPGGFYLLYSAGAGQFALESLGDGDAMANSLFTRHLLPQLQPERTVDELFYAVAASVRTDAAKVPHRQSPASYNQSGRPLRLVPEPGPSVAAATVAAAAGSLAAKGRMDQSAVLLVAMQGYQSLHVPAENGATGYDGADLVTPHRDVRRLDRAFRALGAECLTVLEPDRADLAEACISLREIGRRDLVVYFAGAGGLRGGDGTILIRSDRLDDQGRRLIDYVSSGELAAMLLPQRAMVRDRCIGRSTTLLIDSCLVDHGFKVDSDGPLPLIESLRRGDRDDVALLYSAAYGQAAADWIELPGAPQTSPCAQALVELLATPITVGGLAAALRSRVEMLTEGAQTPQLFASPRAIARSFIAPPAGTSEIAAACTPSATS